MKQEQRCKDWPWPLSWVCSVVTFIVKVIVSVWRKIIRVVCEVVSVVVNILAAVVNFVLAIPIIGPLIRAWIRVITGFVSYVLGLVDGLGRLVGFEPPSTFAFTSCRCVSATVRWPMSSI